MATAPKEYTRLTRSRGRVLFGTHTLWLAKDHLLLVANYGFWENYRRFYFRDIQQISVVKTAWSTVVNAVLGALLAFSAALLTVAGRVFEEAGLWLAAWGAVTALTMLALNFRRGTSCFCQLRTAVQTTELKPLGWLRPAMEGLARLRPLIEAAQGGPATAEMLDTKPVAPQAADAAALRTPRETRARTYGGGAHAVTFAMVLLGSLGSFAQFYRPHVAIYVADTVVTMGTLVAVVAALIKQRGSLMGGGLRGLTWAVMGLLLVLMAVGSVEGLVLSMRNPDVANNTWEMMKLIAAEKTVWRQVVLVVSGVWGAALGLSGTILLLNFWKSRKVQPAAPAAGRP
jgi:hypothetical protein